MSKIFFDDLKSFLVIYRSLTDEDYVVQIILGREMTKKLIFFKNVGNVYVFYLLKFI